MVFHSYDIAKVAATAATVFYEFMEGVPDTHTHTHYISYASMNHQQASNIQKKIPTNRLAEAIARLSSAYIHTIYICVE